MGSCFCFVCQVYHEPIIPASKVKIVIKVPSKICFLLLKLPVFCEVSLPPKLIFIFTFVERGLVAFSESWLGFCKWQSLTPTCQLWQLIEEKQYLALCNIKAELEYSSRESGSSLLLTLIHNGVVIPGSVITVTISFITRLQYKVKTPIAIEKWMFEQLMSLSEPQNNIKARTLATLVGWRQRRLA